MSRTSVRVTESDTFRPFSFPLYSVWLTHCSRIEYQFIFNDLSIKLCWIRNNNDGENNQRNLRNRRHI